MLSDSKGHPVNLVHLPLSGAVVFERFDQRVLTPFCERSVSEETRRAYRRVTLEFFRFMGNRHPAGITASDILRWRDDLIARKRTAATVNLKLSIIRSMFDYLKIAGHVSSNPALSKLVPPPALPEDLRGRALALKEVRYLLCGPDRNKPEGARDYALLMLMLRTGLRVSEACSIKQSAMNWSHGRWVIRIKVKGGRARSLPLPADVRDAIHHYLKLDRTRREKLHSDAPDAFVFQPVTNYRTLTFDKSLSTTMAWYIVRKWGEFAGVGKVTPHDLRRTAITRAFDQGLSYRQIQAMSGHKDPKSVMRYDHHREDLEQNAVNFLDYTEPGAG